MAECRTSLGDLFWPIAAYHCLHLGCLARFESSEQLDFHLRAHFENPGNRNSISENAQAFTNLAVSWPSYSDDSLFPFSISSTDFNRQNYNIGDANNPYTGQNANMAYGVPSHHFGPAPLIENWIAAPTTGFATANNINQIHQAQLPRPICPDCNQSFSRPSDLERHAKKYQPDLVTFKCHVQGCKYKGSYRKDKVQAHVKSCHPSGGAA